MQLGVELRVGVKIAEIVALPCRILHDAQGQMFRVAGLVRTV